MRRPGRRGPRVAAASLVVLFGASGEAHGGQGEAVTIQLARPAPDTGRPARDIDVRQVFELFHENLSLRSARQRALTGGADAATSRAALLPSLAASAGYGHVDGSVQGSFGDFKDVHYRVVRPLASVGLQVNPVSALQAARAASFSAARAASEADEISVAELGAALLAWLDLARAQGWYAVRLDALKSAEELVAIASTLERSGLGGSADTLRAQVQVARQRDALVALDGDVSVASNALALRVHLPLATRLLAAGPDLRAEDWIAPGADPRTLVDRALAQRPSLRARRAAVDAADKSRSQAVGALAAPSVGAFYQVGAVGTGYADLQGVQRSFGAGVTWDLSPARWRAIDGATSRVAEEELAQAAAAERVEREVRDALAALEASRSRLDPARAAVTAAEEAVRLGSVRYRAGTGAFIEVVEAQKDRDAARLGLVDVVVAIDQTQVRLLAALGGLGRDSLRR